MAHVNPLFSPPFVENRFLREEGSRGKKKKRRKRRGGGAMMEEQGQGQEEEGDGEEKALGWHGTLLLQALTSPLSVRPEHLQDKKASVGTNNQSHISTQDTAVAASMLQLQILV